MQNRVIFYSINLGVLALLPVQTCSMHKDFFKLLRVISHLWHCECTCPVYNGWVIGNYFFDSQQNCLLPYECFQDTFVHISIYSKLFRGVLISILVQRFRFEISNVTMCFRLLDCRLSICIMHYDFCWGHPHIYTHTHHTHNYPLPSS